MHIESLSDIELWHRIKQSDTFAFETLYNTYWEKLYSICYWHLLDQETAKDIVQELFVDIWKKKEELNVIKTVEGYLVAAARNKVFNHIRSLEIKRKYARTINNNEALSHAAVDEHSRSRELQQLYQNQINKLPPKMKQIYVLSKLEGYATPEIAQHLSLSEQTVKNQLATAVKRIREALEPYRLLLVAIIFYLCW